jgi:hypothetical protein
MIWVAWRQHRQQTLAGFGLVALVAVFVLLTGIQMSHTFHASGLADCLKTSNSACGDLAELFMQQFRSLQFFAVLFIALPVLAGLFWGAPLVAREFEHHTERLAWVQSVSRRRWLAWKVGFVATATAIGGAAFASLVSWWMSPLLAASEATSHTGGGGGFDVGLFDLHGVVPVAYALFAFALGLALGHVIGKVVPAMGATLVGFAAARFLIEDARPHYMAPKTASIATSGFFKGPVAPNLPSGSWILNEKTVDATGHVWWQGGGVRVSPAITGRCPGFFSPSGDPAPKAIEACFRHLGLRTVDVYQPAARYWSFQWIEFGIFVALSAALIGFVIWRIKRSG